MFLADTESRDYEQVDVLLMTRLATRAGPDMAGSVDIDRRVIARGDAVASSRTQREIVTIDEVAEVEQRVRAPGDRQV